MVKPANRHKAASNIGHRGKSVVNSPEMPINSDIDGLYRTRQEEKDLNLLFNRIKNSADGERMLKYLRSITHGIVFSPSQMTMENQCALNHLEGQRYLVGVIEQRISKGSRNE